MDQQSLENIIEAALIAAGKPLAIKDFLFLFEHEAQPPSKAAIKLALTSISSKFADGGIELIEVASGFRLQARQTYAPWVSRLWEDKPPRYSRALLETLALIAYRQPVTRGDIEQVRGVAVSSQIIRTLLDRDWVTVVGHKEVPGRPAMYATTKAFLDYFNLRRLDQLPALAEIKDLESLASLSEPITDTEAKPVNEADSDIITDDSRPNSPSLPSQEIEESNND